MVRSGGSFILRSFSFHLIKPIPFSFKGKALGTRLLIKQLRSCKIQWSCWKRIWKVPKIRFITINIDSLSFELELIMFINIRVLRRTWNLEIIKFYFYSELFTNLDLLWRVWYGVHEHMVCINSKYKHAQTTLTTSKIHINMFIQHHLQVNKIHITLPFEWEKCLKKWLALPVSKILNSFI